MIVKRCGIWVLALLVFGGCAKVQHLDQLLTLKGLADEQQAMKEYVDQQDEKFEQMVAEAKSGTLDSYLNKRKIRRTFGEPIYVKQVKVDDQDFETWMYRYSTEFFSSEKVYITFDDDDNLVESRYTGQSDGEVR